MINIMYGKENYVPVSGANVSEGGILCECDEYIEPHSKLYIMFELPGKNGSYKITCDGLTVRSDLVKGKYITGIQFTDLNKDARTHLKKFVDAH